MWGGQHGFKHYYEKRMEHSIVRKLRDHLSLRIKTECAVVYLLAQVRKLLDPEKRGDKWFALTMYCNWALHVNLTWPKTTKEFLERVDAFILKTVHPYDENPGTVFSFIDEHHLFREFVYLDSFRYQLRELLERHNLPTTLCEDNSEWFTFLSAYAGVIEDGELSIMGRKSPNLGAVKKVVFRKGQISAWPASHVPFSLQWDIHLLDGRICEAQLSADENAKGISHSLSIRGDAKPVPAFRTVHR